MLSAFEASVAAVEIESVTAPVPSGTRLIESSSASGAVRGDLVLRPTARRRLVQPLRVASDTALRRSPESTRRSLRRCRRPSPSGTALSPIGSCTDRDAGDRPSGVDASAAVDARAVDVLPRRAAAIEPCDEESAGAVGRDVEVHHSRSVLLLTCIRGSRRKLSPKRPFSRTCVFDVRLVSHATKNGVAVGVGGVAGTRRLQPVPASSATILEVHALT